MCMGNGENFRRYLGIAGKEIDRCGAVDVLDGELKGIEERNLEKILFSSRLRYARLCFMRRPILILASAEKAWLPVKMLKHGG